MPRGSRFPHVSPLPIRIKTTTLILALLFPAGAGARPDSTGIWTSPSPSWGHMGIHLALLRGNGIYHSKLLSWDENHPGYATTRGTLWGWNPSAGVGDNNCSELKSRGG